MKTIYLDNSGFDTADGERRYMTEGMFTVGPKRYPVARVAVFERSEDGQCFTHMDTVRIPRRLSQERMRPETIIRKVAEAIAERDGLEAA